VSYVSFPSKEDHIAALYDACKLISDTYYSTDLLDGADFGLYTPFHFAKVARNVLNQIAEGHIK
jgi:hypothetical protein